MRGKRHINRHIAECISNGALHHTSDGNDIARNRFINGHALKTTEAEHFRDTTLFDELAISAQHFERLVRLY